MKKLLFALDELRLGNGWYPLWSALVSSEQAAKLLDMRLMQFVFNILDRLPVRGESAREALLCRAFPEPPDTETTDAAYEQWCSDQFDDVYPYDWTTWGDAL